MNLLDSFLRDLRLAARALRQTPSFTLIAILTLGLGIGANTAIFTVVDAILLRPLAAPHPEQLVSVRESSRQFPTEPVAYPNYLDWRAQNQSFSALAAYRGEGGVLTQHGPPAVIIGMQCTSQYLALLGVKPALGRIFTADEDKPGAPAVIVLSYRLWQERFGGDPTWIGRSLDLDAQPRTIIGVMPSGFHSPGRTSSDDLYWVPLGPLASTSATQGVGLLDRGSHPGLSALGRLKPGVTFAQSQADIKTIAARLAQAYPKDDTGHGVSMKPLLDYIVSNTRPALWLLLAAVGCVLLIACANVAHLLLARAAARQKPAAIRAALGASRAQLMRQSLAESLALGVAGSAVGLALAAACAAAGPRLIPDGVPRASDLSLDWRVLAFTLLLALATSLICGLVPALRAARANVSDVLKEGGRESGGARGRPSGHRLRGILVAGETALAIVLLVGTGLLIRSLLALQRVDSGFNLHGVLTFDVGLADARYPKSAQQTAFFGQALDRMQSVPGVAAVGAIMPLPFGGSEWEEEFAIAGRPAPTPGNEPDTDFAMVRGNYFQAMGMRLLRGRRFSEADNAKAPLVVIIDDSFAREYWPGADPLRNALGQQIKLDTQMRTIVGIVAHVKNYGLDGISRVESFIPAQQRPEGDDDMIFAVRAQPGIADPMSLRSAAAAQIQTLDADQPLYDTQTMDQRVALSMAQRRLITDLMGGFAFLALVLAAIGMYGVVSYGVAQRTHEIGIRMALGARRGQVLGLALRQGMAPALVGTAIGLAGALALGRWVQSLSGFLYGVPAADPATLAAVPAALLAAALLACYVPARRASGIDPMAALRDE